MVGRRSKKWNPVINFVGLASGIFQCELVIHATVIEKRKMGLNLPIFNSRPQMINNSVSCLGPVF